jgi:hypothetical protein
MSAEELAVGWRSAPNAATGGGSPASDHAGLTNSGLPRRVPKANGSPGSNMPGSAVPFAPADTPAPVLAAPLDGTASQGVPYQEAAHQEQQASRRRSPEAVRSRLSGFQLGGRDAVQAGYPTGPAPLAGEENSR